MMINYCYETPNAPSPPQQRLARRRRARVCAPLGLYTIPLDVKLTPWAL